MVTTTQRHCRFFRDSFFFGTSHDVAHITNRLWKVGETGGSQGPAASGLLPWIARTTSLSLRSFFWGPPPASLSEIEENGFRFWTSVRCSLTQKRVWKGASKRTAPKRTTRHYEKLLRTLDPCIFSLECQKAASDWCEALSLKDFSWSIMA